ncbi:MAG: hypothetical protein AAF566_02080 [Pseudomonadota bacterium]
MTSGDLESPALSIVLVGRDGYRTLAAILACLSEQTIANKIEIIAVLPEAETTDNLPGETATAFQAIVPVVVGKIVNRGTAAARGVLQARAPVIGFSENHCFPDPGWAEALLPHFDDPKVSGAAPVVENGNPEGALSWASFTASYAHFLSEEVRDVDAMPQHNALYRASEFHNRSDRLGALLTAEGAFQAEIREAGGRFVLEPAARTRHISEGTWDLAVGLNYVNGCLYGGKRAQELGWPERIARAAAFPLAAVQVFRNNARRISGVPGAPKVGGEMALALAAMSVAHAFGEARAYLGYSRKEFKIHEDEVYLITEKLGRHPLTDPRLKGFIAHYIPEGS